jgi:hypothetical protein
VLCSAKILIAEENVLKCYEQMRWMRGFKGRERFEEYAKDRGFSLEIQRGRCILRKGVRVAQPQDKGFLEEGNP